MFTDASIGVAAEAMLARIEVPSVPLAEIRRSMEQPQLAASALPAYTRPAIAAAAILVGILALPSIAPALVQSLDAQYRAALQALGGIAPPSPPQAFVAKIAPQSVTFSQAQARVHFALVAPEGLPADATLSSIHAAPIGVFGKTAQAWRVGPSGVSFAYHRSDGREFVLMASRYDPSDPPAHYIFEAKLPDAAGRPVLVKHERFAWRNGDQVITAMADSDISATEIAAIQAAMHGVSVPRRDPHTSTSGGDLFYRVVPKP